MCVCVCGGGIYGGFHLVSQGPVLGDGSWKHLWVFSFLLSLCKSSWIVCSLEAEFFMCLVHFFLVFLFVCLFVCLFSIHSPNQKVGLYIFCSSGEYQQIVLWSYKQPDSGGENKLLCFILKVHYSIYIVRIMNKKVLYNALLTFFLYYYYYHGWLVGTVVFTL